MSPFKMPWLNSRAMLQLVAREVPDTAAGHADDRVAGVAGETIDPVFLLDRYTDAASPRRWPSP